MKENTSINSIVLNQLLPNNITKDSVLQLFQNTDKTIFVNEDDRSFVNIDENFFFNNKRFILKNTTIGKLIELIIKEKNYLNVLNIGSTTGFTSVLLSKISNYVISLESERSLHEKEKKIIKNLDIKNIYSVCGNLENGLKEYFPYDLIFVNGGIKKKPNILLEQLNESGYLICIEQTNINIKKIVRYFKKKDIIEKKTYYSVNSPILF
jgi:protein-L-isoaspartate(D-aspartate) O-methyltransferase|tara:strand:- start:1224 stop:1850 length:627 start_codon:yes stop_codon:yes gene_type:complete